MGVERFARIGFPHAAFTSRFVGTSDIICGRLASDALRGWEAWGIALVSLAVLLRWKVSPAWVVLGGGVLGLLLADYR
jgi:hypothetical protein